MKYLFLLLSFSISILVSAQSDETNAIFDSFKLKYSDKALNEAKLEYEQANDTVKAIMRQVYLLPYSSRQELISNYEKKKKEILELKDTYEKMIPEGYIVFLELKQSERIQGMVVGIDLQIYKKDDSGELEFVDGDWDMEYSSEELTELLDIIGWDRMSLLAIKNIIQTANCVSIQNGEYTEIGFARSGLGKYFYELFPKKLSKSEIEKYNDGCEYLYYKNNVVLRYAAGMAGAQCFTD